MNKTLLYIINFFNKGWQVSFVVLLPFLQKDLHIGLIEVGFLSMNMVCFIIIASFFAGYVNDYLGNKKVVLLSLISIVLAWFCFSIAHTSFVLYVV